MAGKEAAERIFAGLFVSLICVLNRMTYTEFELKQKTSCKCYIID